MAVKKRIAVLGSTGSIGHQTLEVVRQQQELFSVELLTAHAQWQLLVEQALEFRPRAVVIDDTSSFPKVVQALSGTAIQVYAGNEAIENLVRQPEIDVVVVAIVGYAALLPAIRAIEEGKTIALANKEALVVAGSIIMELAAKYNAHIVPVDSEHSAIFQCLSGELTPPEKLIITASGGPFLSHTLEQLDRVTPQEALMHPAWNMGAKISIDSATLMNKGLEVIEAHWLFNVPFEKIDVLIHPQAVIHSMVQFADGAIKAQMAVPDMRIPIQYALTYPYRISSPFQRYCFGPAESLTFDAPDVDRFPCLNLAIEAGKAGGNTPCVLNAANEIAVEAFLSGQIGYTGIPVVVERTLETIDYMEAPSLDDLIATNQEARKTASWLVEKLNS